VRVDGVDVSHWNRPSGDKFDVRFAICKATQGVTYRDRTLPDWWARWHADGVQTVGAYHWIQGNHPVAKQFEWFCAYLDENGGLGPSGIAMLDWERTNIGGEWIVDPTVAQVEEWVRLSNERFGANRTFVYSAPWVPEFKEWRAANPDVNLIVANYTKDAEAVASKYGAAAVQWSSSATVKGVAAPCDANQILRQEAFDALVPQSPVWVPKPTLRTGSVGSEVSRLIDLLKINGFYPKRWMGDVNDGKFGARTTTGVKNFQRVRGGTVDGIYGNKSAARLSRGLIDGTLKSAR